MSHPLPKRKTTGKKGGVVVIPHVGCIDANVLLDQRMHSNGLFRYPTSYETPFSDVTKDLHS